MPAAADIGRQRSRRDPQLKRLIIRPGAIGDCIVSLPAIEHLTTDYTEVWVPRAVAPLVRTADRVRALPSTGIDLVGITNPALPVFSEFDDIVSWYGANRPEFRDTVTHLPFRLFPAMPDGSCHAVDLFMRHIGGPDGAVPHIECPRHDAGFIAIHPFSGSPRKNWPLKQFRELASRLPLPVRFCVSPVQEFGDAVQIDDLYDLACWLARGRLYIGNDSGITHLAAAVGVPVVALFGPMEPSVWGPRSRAPVKVIRHEPMEEISVDQVLEAASAALACGLH